MRRADDGRDGGTDPGAPTAPPPSRPRGVLVGPVLLALVAVALTAAGHPRRAVVAALSAACLGAILVASPRAGRSLARAGAALGRVVGRVLDVLLLVPAYFLVVLPLGLLLRVIGASPVDLRRDPTRASYWTVRESGSDRFPKRMYADQRGWRPGPLSRGQRRRIVAGAVVATVAAQGALVGGVALVRQRSTPSSPPPAGVTTIEAPRSAALADLDWAPAALAEQQQLLAGSVHAPFVGLALRDFHGESFTVEDRVRRSYVTPLATQHDPVEVWFFGGSTMLGLDLQRDEHTIPSEVVRLAEADGIAVEARNYGMFGFVNYQETVLLALLVTGSPPPDLVVFYDGTNDFTMHLLNASGALNQPGEPGTLDAQQARLATASGLMPASIDGPPPPLATGAPPGPLTVDRLVGDLVDVYQQGIDLASALGERHGFELVHFWQPDLLSRQPLDPGERAVFPSVLLDDERYERLRALRERVRAALPAGVVDITDAYDDVDGPVLSDLTHANEVGGRAVAEAMYEELRPRLRALAG